MQSRSDVSYVVRSPLDNKVVEWSRSGEWRNAWILYSLVICCEETARSAITVKRYRLRKRRRWSHRSENTAKIIPQLTWITTGTNTYGMRKKRKNGKVRRNKNGTNPRAPRGHPRFALSRPPHLPPLRMFQPLACLRALARHRMASLVHLVEIPNWPKKDILMLNFTTTACGKCMFNHC